MPLSCKECDFEFTDNKFPVFCPECGCLMGGEPPRWYDTVLGGDFTLDNLLSDALVFTQQVDYGGDTMTDLSSGFHSGRTRMWIPLVQAAVEERRSVLKPFHTERRHLKLLSEYLELLREAFNPINHDKENLELLATQFGELEKWCLLDADRIFVRQAAEACRKYAPVAQGGKKRQNKPTGCTSSIAVIFIVITSLIFAITSR